MNKITKTITKTMAAALLAIALAVCGICAAMLSAFADVSATPQNGYGVTNVARGKLASYTEIDGTEIPRDQLRYLHGTDFAAFDPYTALTDGDHEPGENHSIVNVVKSDGSELRSFAVIDLEQAYTVTGLNVDFWHDHSFIEVVIQVANSADFSDAVTVLNNDTANEMKCGAGTGEALQNVSTKGVDVSFSPVYGRYVRVSGRDVAGGIRFTEIEVYGVTDGLAPVAGNLALEKQDKDALFTLTTEISGAKIYYTTDGTIPTEKSTEYISPITLSSVGNYKAYIRAVAIKDGVATLPSDFKFDITEQSENLALGIIPTFDEGVTLASYPNENSSTIESITDGVGDSFNFMYSSKFTWLYLDLGDVYKICKVSTKFWNDHSFLVVIQTATDPDFTENLYTVFNNDTSNLVGVGAGTDGTYTDSGYANPSVMNEFNFYPVSARYVRVWAQDTDGRAYSLWEEIQVWSAAAPDETYDVPAKNVALGIIPTFDEGVTLNSYPSENSSTIESITDGVGDSDNFMYSNKIAWLYLDLGEEIVIDKIATKFWYNNSFLVVIQTATDPDFTENLYTVFNNDTNNLVGVGAGTDGTYTDLGSGSVFNTFTFEKRAARYIRVWAQNTDGRQYSMWEEIQVWSAVIEGVDLPIEEYPVRQSAIVKATGIGDFSAANGSTEEDLADNLPATIAVEDFNGNKGTVSGTWSCDNYDSALEGDYDFVFTPTGSEWLDLYEILRVTVTVAPAADRSALDAAIQAAQALNQEDYVSSSWSNLAEPLAAAIRISEKRLLLQSEADGALADLQTAVSNLKRRGDKTALNAMLATVNALTQSDYSAASWAALQSEIASATEIAQNADVTQTVVDLTLADLSAAYDALQRLGDSTALAARYNELKDTQNIYTPSSWATFAAALADAEEILDKDEAYQDEMDAALAALENAYAALNEKADFTALDAAIAEAEALTLADYTEDTAAEFSASLAAAKEVSADGESLQTDVDAALADLTAKRAALTKKADKTELNSLIASCNYARENYTASSYNEYINAKQKAEAVAASENATQADVDEVKAELTEKTAALTAIGNKTDLLAAIAEAEGVEKEGYSEEIFAEFESALNYAKSVAESNDVDQATVDDALSLLTAKREALAKEAKKGCGSFITTSESLLVALASLFGAAVVLKRKSRKKA